MREASKAMRRRMADTSFPWREIFKGQVLDVGSGDDGIKIDACVTYFDQPDGSGDDITKFFPYDSGFYDTLHSSNCLEHMSDPVVALKSWIKLVKVRGHIVFTVPDFILYEKLRFPSRWNAGHCSTWSLTHKGSPAGRMHCKLPEWLDQFNATVLRCALVDTNFNYSLGPEVDQTFRYEDGVETFCEVVLRV